MTTTRESLKHWSLAASIVCLLVLTYCNACPRGCRCDIIHGTYYVNCSGYSQSIHEQLPTRTKYLYIYNLSEPVHSCVRQLDSVYSVYIRQSSFNNIPLGWMFLCYPAINKFDITGSAFNIRESTFASNGSTERLDYLELDSNRMHSVDSGAFKRFSNLEKLVLKNNTITILHRNAFIGLNELKSFTFDGNILDGYQIHKDTFAILPNLDTFEIKTKGLGEISLDKLPFLRLPMLKTLSLSGDINAIRSDTFCSLSSLKYLKLPSLKCTELSLGFLNCLSKLSSIELRNSDIRALVLNKTQRSTSIETVDLYGSELTSFPVGILQQFKVLRELYLDANPLILKKHDLTNATCDLEVLGLSRCNLHFIPEDYFKSCAKLKTLNLQSNSIMVLPRIVATNIKTKIILDSNPIYCGCQQKGIRLLTLEPPTQTTGATFTCDTPPGMRGKGTGYNRSPSVTAWQEFLQKLRTMPRCTMPRIKYFTVMDESISLIECQAYGDPPPQLKIKEPQGREHNFDLVTPGMKNVTLRVIGSAFGTYLCTAYNDEGEITKELRMSKERKTTTPTSGYVTVETTRDSQSKSSSDTAGTNLLVYVVVSFLIGCVLTLIIVGTVVFLVKRNITWPCSKSKYPSLPESIDVAEMNQHTSA